MSVEDTGWATIDTAPRDGTKLILWATYSPAQEPFAVMGRFSDSGLGWVSDDLSGQGSVQLDPTHWLPIPSPPK